MQYESLGDRSGDEGEEDDLRKGVFSTLPRYAEGGVLHVGSYQTNSTFASASTSTTTSSSTGTLCSWKRWNGSAAT
eukprot:2884822-Rhodomonas_salina.3